MYQILGYILYFILLFITVTWMLGVRFKADVVYPTVLGSIYFLILTVIVPLVGVNFLNLLWLIPIVYFMTLGNIYLWAYKIPIVTTILSIICDLYTAILRIGMDPAEIKRRREFLDKQFIDEWAKKHMDSE